MVKIIKNGRVIDPESRFDGRADLWIENGKIQKIVKKDTKAESDGASDAPSIPADAEVLDAEGLIVAPGLVDVHVHFRDPGLTYKEDIETGAAAAKAGGFTTVVCMANTKPVADTPEIVRYILEKGAKTGIHVETCAAVSKGFQGKELTDMDALKEAGAIGFTDDGIPLMSEKLVKEAMETAKRLNVPLSFHEEDPAFIFNNGINRGPVSEQLGIGGSPALAEDSMVARDCMIALHTGADVDIQHISSRNAVQMVGLAKKLGAHVWAEVTPHHFTLDETAVLEYGTLAKMNPPLRSAADREALIEAIKDGKVVSVITRQPMKQVQLRLNPSHTNLTERHTYDVAAVRIEARSDSGNLLPFYQEPVQLTVTGDIALIGPSLISLKGGMGGTYVKSLGREGQGTLTVSAPGAPDVIIDFQVSLA